MNGGRKEIERKKVHREGGAGLRSVQRGRGKEEGRQGEQKKREGRDGGLMKGTEEGGHWKDGVSNVGKGGTRGRKEGGKKE